MLTNLFSDISNLIYLIIGIIFALGLIYIVIKLPNGKFFALGFLVVVLIISGILTAFANYEWMTARGGIYGAIEDIKNANKVVQNELTFDFEAFTLEATGNKDEYMARMTINNVDNLDLSNKTIYVNSEPTSLVASSKKYIISKYSYLFQNEDLQEISVDTLKIRFSFGEKLSECVISTTGGFKNVKLWNEYIEKNGFKVIVKDFDYTPNLEIVGRLGTFKISFNYSEDLDDKIFGAAQLTRIAGDQKQAWQFPIKNKTYTMEGISIYGDYTLAFSTTPDIKQIETISFNFSEEETDKTFEISVEKAPLTYLVLTAGGKSEIQFTKISKTDNQFCYQTDLLKINNYQKDFLNSLVARMTTTGNGYFDTSGISSFTINYYSDNQYSKSLDTISYIELSSSLVEVLYGFESENMLVFSFPEAGTSAPLLLYCPETDEICIVLYDKPNTLVNMAIAEAEMNKGETELSIQLVLK